jgi:hypothetical protein
LYERSIESFFEQNFPFHLDRRPVVISGENSIWKMEPQDQHLVSRSSVKDLSPGLTRYDPLFLSGYRSRRNCCASQGRCIEPDKSSSVQI